MNQQCFSAVWEVKRGTVGKAWLLSRDKTEVSREVSITQIYVILKKHANKPSSSYSSQMPARSWQEAKLSLGLPTLLPHSRLSSNQRLLLNSISSCFRDITL